MRLLPYGRLCLLAPCPGCRRTRPADEGHRLCRECEGYPLSPSEQAVIDGGGP